MHRQIAKILIAEDESLFRKTLVKILSSNINCELVGQAADGIAALELILTHHPDIVITDIKMPGMDGIELIRQSIENGEECKFIIVSGYADFEYARNALKLQADEYLLKPIDPDALLSAIDKIVTEQNRKDEVTSLRRKYLWKGLSLCNLLTENLWMLDKNHVNAILVKLTTETQSLSIGNHRAFSELLQDLYDYILNDITLRMQMGDIQSQLTKLNTPIEGMIDFNYACNTIYDELCNKRNYSHSSKIKKLIKLIDEQFPVGNCSLAFLADKLQISSTYLSAIFKKEMGYSFMDYLVQRKIALAKELLHSDDKIYQVSEKLGYEDVAHFSKIFKKHAGMTPLEYKHISG